MKTAILLYLYHIDLWEEYKNLIKRNCSNYSLFLSVCSNNNNKNIIKDCKKNFKNCFIQEFENKGVDVGPFLKQLDIVDEKEYPFFIKLHSKKSLINNKINWRVDLVNSLIGNKFTYLKNLDLIKKPYVGCICNKYFLNKDQNKLFNKIKEILTLLGMSYEDVIYPEYIAGNIFLSKTAIFKKYFNSNIIKIIYEKLEGYGEIPKEGSYNHSLEVINGYILKKENLKILDGIVKSKIIYNKNYNNNRIHLIKLYNDEYTAKENILIRGKLNNDYIFWDHIGVNQKYKNISGKLAKVVESSFDKTVYKLLNKEKLKSINFENLEKHYEDFGKKEGLITKEDITKVFDENFYKEYYNLDNIKNQEIFQNYILKGFIEGRIYNPIIIDDNFDYGFYQSYQKIFKNKNFNQYTALSDYINTKNKCNNKINYFNHGVCIKKMLCVYSCDIKTKKDFYILKTNLDILKKVFEKIIIVNSSGEELFLPDKKILCINTKIKNNYKKYLKILNNNKYVCKYNHICLINNNVVIIKNLNNFLKKYSKADCTIYSTTDCYLESYHIDDSFLIFNTKNLSIIKKALLKVNKIELSKFLIKKGYNIGSFFQINQVKELFWRNLFFNINNFPEILIENNVPIIDKSNMKYLIKLIPKEFKKIKNKSKIQSFFNLKLNKINIKKIFNIDFKNIKFCLILHIKDINKLNEYENFIKILKNKINVDILLTTNTFGIKEHIQNKGMDIGPFIKTFSKIDKHYDYVIKLHSKNFKAFRNYCFNNIINFIYHHILLLEKNKNLICSGPKLCYMHLDNINKSKIDEFLFRNKFNLNTTENSFFAGTMFVAKYNFFNNFFKNINILEEYNLLENKHVINNIATYTHAWERILTNIIPNYYGMKNTYI